VTSAMSFRRHGRGGEEGGGRHRRMQNYLRVHKERLFGVDVGGGKEEEDKHQVQEFFFKFVHYALSDHRDFARLSNEEKCKGGVEEEDDVVRTAGKWHSTQTRLCSSICSGNCKANVPFKIHTQGMIF
jgi:hypothetical protein